MVIVEFQLSPQQLQHPKLFLGAQIKMAHFAKLDATGTVVFVTKGRDEDSGKELEICARTGETYRQTSYNTSGGVHYTNGEPSEDQSKAFRKNFAGVGFRYDVDRDAFIPPRPFPSWTLNETTCLWECPVERPAGVDNYWDESSKSWVESPQ